MMATGQSDDIWEAYWRSGQATRCAGPHESEYVEELTRAWLRFEATTSPVHDETGKHLPGRQINIRN